MLHISSIKNCQAFACGAKSQIAKELAVGRVASLHGKPRWQLAESIQAKPMDFNPKTFRFSRATLVLSSLCICCLAIGCAVIAPEDQVKQQDAAKLTPAQARDDLRELMTRQTKTFWLPSFGAPKYLFKDFTIGFDGFDYNGKVFDSHSGFSGKWVHVHMKFPYRTVRNIEVMRFGEKGNVRFYVKTDGEPEFDNRV